MAEEDNSDQESDNTDQESDDTANSSELAQEEKDLKSKDATIRERALTKRLNRVVKQNQRFRAERRSTSNNTENREENNNDQASLPAGVTERLIQASFVAQSSGLVDADLVYTVAKASGLLKTNDNFEVTNYKDVIKELRTKHPSIFTKGNIGGNNGNTSDVKPQTMDQIIRGLSGRRG